MDVVISKCDSCRDQTDGKAGPWGMEGEGAWSLMISLMVGAWDLPYPRIVVKISLLEPL